MFISYILPFELGPMAYNFYQNYRQSIEKLHQEFERYGKLGERAEYWEAENQRAKQEHEKIEAGLLPGNNRDLVGAKMQGLVRQLAQNADITFKSLDPPDSSFNTDKWVLVIQTMQFEANSGTLIAFLKALNNAKENLAVVMLNLRSHRKKLSGTIKITGFSRVPSQPLNEE